VPNTIINFERNLNLPKTSFLFFVVTTTNNYDLISEDNYSILNEMRLYITMNYSRFIVRFCTLVISSIVNLDKNIDKKIVFECE